ncbi:MAG: CocE/NonD family hydrolase [Clostridia bacterium]|nr:CocE/NonD family hydrolase [Clostridia bacterium]
MYSYHEYLSINGAELFTFIMLPEKEGKFPTVVVRIPYVDDFFDMTDEEAVAKYSESTGFADNGFAYVIQHCRGCGKSSGDCIPYINEREDGLHLREWIRKQSFYNGQILLSGGSYLSSVHYTTAPFESDVVGAVLRVQDTERYNCNFRNGFYKSGLHGSWYVGMYKRKARKQKCFTAESYNLLPLRDFTKTVLGEPSADFDEILRHPDKNDDFWTTTRYGGADGHDALKDANIPILITTGFYDIYTGGIFDMWNNLSPETREKCAFMVHPYAHSGLKKDSPLEFPNGEFEEQFKGVEIKWMKAVLGKGEYPVERGKVTYYRLFDNKWATEDFKDGEKIKRIIIGEGEKTYTYNPFSPARFKGGLSCNFGGTAIQDAPNSRYDIISFYTDEFAEDTFVKGRMRAKLTVKSDCEDTCFYMRISITNELGDVGLRDDINSICNFNPNYVPGEYQEMDFVFDEHAFLIKKGQKLRIDISSSAFGLYVRHTNVKGLYCDIETAKVAHNTVVLDKSYLELCCEK